MSVADMYYVSYNPWFARKCKSVPSPLIAKSIIDKPTILCGVILAIAVANSFVQHKCFLGISGLFALITMIYMIVARNRLKVS